MYCTHTNMCIALSGSKSMHAYGLVSRQQATLEAHIHAYRSAYQAAYTECIKMNQCHPCTHSPPPALTAAIPFMVCRTSSSSSPRPNMILVLVTRCGYVFFTCSKTDSDCLYFALRSRTVGVSLWVGTRQGRHSEVELEKIQARPRHAATLFKCNVCNDQKHASTILLHN